MNIRQNRLYSVLPHQSHGRIAHLHRQWNKRRTKKSSASSPKRKSCSNSTSTSSKISSFVSKSKLLKSAQRVRKNQKKLLFNIAHGDYTKKPIFKLREKNPVNYIHDESMVFNYKNENYRVNEVRHLKLI